MRDWVSGHVETEFGRILFYCLTGIEKKNVLPFPTSD